MTSRELAPDKNTQPGGGILPRPTVLVVDDEALIRWSLSQAFADAGYEVEEAGDGREAEARLAQHRGRAFAVVLDLRLPDVSDLSLLRTIRSRWPAVPVVILTALEFSLYTAEAGALGAAACLAKPFDVAEVVAAVRSAWTAPSGLYS